MQVGQLIRLYPRLPEKFGVNFYVMVCKSQVLGTLIGGINFLVTIINMRAPGMTYMRMPLFTWTAFVTSATYFVCFPCDYSWSSRVDV